MISALPPYSSAIERGLAPNVPRSLYSCVRRSPALTRKPWRSVFAYDAFRPFILASVLTTLARSGRDISAPFDINITNRPARRFRFLRLGSRFSVSVFSSAFPFGETT